MWDIVSYRTGSRFLLFNVYIERVVLTEEDLGAYKKFLKRKKYHCIYSTCCRVYSKWLHSMQGHIVDL